MKEKSGTDARAAVAGSLKGLLVDPSFISTYFDEQKGEAAVTAYATWARIPETIAQRAIGLSPREDLNPDRFSGLDSP